MQQDAASQALQTAVDQCKTEQIKTRCIKLANDVRSLKECNVAMFLDKRQKEVDAIEDAIQQAAKNNV